MQLLNRQHEIALDVIASSRWRYGRYCMLNKIAERLGISPREAQPIVARLIAVGRVEQLESGWFGVRG